MFEDLRKEEREVSPLVETEMLGELVKEAVGARLEALRESLHTN
jgi:hypothetical protein